MGPLWLGHCLERIRGMDILSCWQNPNIGSLPVGTQYSLTKTQYSEDGPLKSLKLPLTPLVNQIQDCLPRGMAGMSATLKDERMQGWWSPSCSHLIHWVKCL